MSAIIATWIIGSIAIGLILGKAIKSVSDD